MDFLNPSAKYELLIDNVPRLHDVTGGLLQKLPIVCGGDSNGLYDHALYDHETGHWNLNDKHCGTQDCIVIGNPAIDMKMLEMRSNLASVVLQGESVQTVII